MHADGPHLLATVRAEAHNWAKVEQRVPASSGTWCLGVSCCKLGPFLDLYTTLFLYIHQSRRKAFAISRKKEGQTRQKIMSDTILPNRSMCLDMKLMLKNIQ
jgi:hypothetical protein